MPGGGPGSDRVAGTDRERASAWHFCAQKCKARAVTVPEAIERFLTGVRTASWDHIEDHLDPEVVYDASVPGWHYQYQGRARIAAEYRSEWTGRHPWRLLELNVDRCASGDVLVDFEARWGDPGDEEACRMANIFRFNAAGLICEHRLYCCGEWDPETVRHVDTSAPRVALPPGRPPSPASP